MQYSTTKHVFLNVLQWKIRFVQVSTLTWNCTNAVFQRKTRCFVCFTVKNQLCASADSIFKSHTCDYLSQNVYLSVLRWKTRFVQLLTFILICTNEIFHHKIHLFECFAVENPICASVKCDLILHKCVFPPQNAYFCALYCEKSALCKCQVWL